jgi:hypothetical protein
LLLKRLPPKNSFNFGNKWKSLGAKSGLYLGCSKTSQTNSWSIACVLAAAYGRASRQLTIGPTVGFEWRTVTASELHNTIGVDGCALRHELNQKDAFPVPKHCGHDFPSGQCLLKLPGFWRRCRMMPL